MVLCLSTVESPRVGGGVGGGGGSAAELPRDSTNLTSPSFTGLPSRSEDSSNPPSRESGFTDSQMYDGDDMDDGVNGLEAILAKPWRGTRISSVHVASATLAFSIVLVAVTLFSFFDDANAEPLRLHRSPSRRVACPARIKPSW